MTQEQENTILQAITENKIKTETTISMLNKLDARLFGNGQPGALKLLENRIESQEGFSNRARGAIAILGFIGLTSLGDLLIRLGGK